MIYPKQGYNQLPLSDKILIFIDFFWTGTDLFIYIHAYIYIYVASTTVNY